MFRKDQRKRRSDRLMFMIPLRVEGRTKSGEAFECGGHAVDVNRHGAHIRLDRPVDLAHTIRLTNLENNLRGEFRIVKALEGPGSERTDFGVEALGSYPIFWGIEFPAQPKKPDESRGLLECLQCRSASLQPLSLDEIEILESGGTVRKPCRSCRSRTECKFAMAGVSPVRLHLQPPSPAAGLEDAPDRKKRSSTIFVQRPVLIRTASGETETVQTENLSAEEIRCASGKTYELNQVVTLEWENSRTGQRLQVQGRICTRQVIAGSPRAVYSIRYEGAPATLPPAPLKPAGMRYGSAGALIAAASLLVAFSARELALHYVIPSGPSARMVVLLGAVLLLVSIAYKNWTTILTREPESRRPFRKRHRIATSLAGIVFLGSMAGGAAAGVAGAREIQRQQLFLQHLALARAFESNINSAENRVMTAPADFADACATLRLLAPQWQEQLAALSAVAGQLSRARLIPNAKVKDAINGLTEIMSLDRRKLRLVREQISLEAESKNLDPQKRLAFWESSFPPLRQKILGLDAKKNQAIKSLAAQK